MLDRWILKAALPGLLFFFVLGFFAAAAAEDKSPPTDPPMVRGTPEVDATWNGGTGNWNDANAWTFDPTGSFTNPHNTVDHLFNVFIDGGKADNSVVSLNLNRSIQRLTLDAGDELRINNSQRLSLFGDVVNNGLLTVAAGNSGTYLQPVDEIEFSGSGAVVMGGNNAWLYDFSNSNSGPDHLIQLAGHTIRGVGNIGFANNLRITNAGLIHADTDASTLTVRPNDQGMINTGTVRASGGGNLEFLGGSLGTAVINNAGGVIAADGANSTVTYTNNARIEGGELTGTGTHVIGSGNARFDALSNQSTVNINNSQRLSVSGAIANTGVVRVDAGNSSTYLMPVGSATFSGSGTIEMGGSNAWIYDTANAQEHLTQSAGHTIRGVGNIGFANNLRITNAGLIHADTDGGTIDIRPNNDGLKNTGTLRASNGGTLTVTTTNGVLTSLVNNQLVEGTYEVIGDSTMRLGAPVNVNQATILLDGPQSNLFSTASNNALVNFATNQGSFTIRNGRDFSTAGAFVNSGLLHIGATSTFTVASGETLTSTGTLAGAGTIAGIVDNAGLLSPGDSIGSLIIIGDLLVGDGSSYDWEIDGISSDLVSVNNGTLNFNGGTVTINVQFDGTPPFEGLDHVLIDASNATVDQANLPDFAVNLPLGWATDGVEVTSTQVLLTNVGRVFDFGDAPESYGTLRDDDGARHIVTGPWLADFAIEVGDLSLGGNDTTAERDGKPDSEANADDANDGVVLADFKAIPASGRVTCDGVEMPNDEVLDEFAYCAAVRVANPTGDTAYLAAWVDFGATGNFNGPIDRSSPEILLGESGMAHFGGNCDVVESSVQPGEPLGAGNWAIPAHCEGVVVLVWPYSSTDTITDQQTFSRFRISTDPTWGANPSPLGELPDGEVEDHFLNEGTIPVSIHAFESEFTAEGLVVRWSTASETHNMGFYLWGQMAASGRFELLTPQMIASSASDIVEPQSYSVTIPRLTARDVGDLMLTAVDYFGNEEMYGYFSSGHAYGELNPPDPIDWAAIRQQAELTLARSGLVDRGVWRAASLARGQSAIAADFLVTEPGMQRITHEELLAMGLNLAGTDASRIAVTVKGRGVPRAIESPAAGPSLTGRVTGSPSFGPGSAVLFWGEKPAQPKANFIDHLVYRIEIDGNQAIDMGDHDLPVSQPGDLVRARQRRDEDVAYNFSNPSPDPWHLAELRSWQPNRSRFDANFAVSGTIESAHPARVQVDIAGLTAAPLGPDHRIRVLINGTPIGEHSFSGRSVERVAMEVPAHLLNVGENLVRVQSVGFAGINSITLLDAVELSWAEQAQVGNGPMLMTPLLASGQDGVLVEGLGAIEQAQVFVRSDDQVYRVPVESLGDDGVLAIPAGGQQIWVSTVDQFHIPQPLGAVAEHDLMANLGNLLLITLPAFMPASPTEAHPLNAFAEYRRAQGWEVAVVNISDIQLHYGGGMALPQALPRFLADAVRHIRGYPHVLLVGGDSYDYRNVLGQGSLSFIPTQYAATQWVPHTPSDALLADLSGDGLSDLPLGRWPVRTLADLQAHVDKVMDWEMNLAGHWSAAWLTDEADPNLAPFRGQVERLSDLMVEGGVMSSSIEQIIFEEAGSASAARAELFSALEQGRTLTGFSGHGSPTLWSFQGILRPSDVADLNNHGVPTLIGTLACYTTYFNSPFSNTLAHRLMNGLSADGVSADRNGAVAIHGAATLSSMSHNEAFARDVLVEQMAGRTLGEAIVIARANAARRGHADLVINWTLLGDPTLQLQFSRGAR